MVSEIKRGELVAMPRGGKRPGAGRKRASKGPEVQIHVRLAPAVRQQVERLAIRNNGASLTKQVELLILRALHEPEWPIDEEWRGAHQLAFARLVAHAAGRLEAVLGFQRPDGWRWSDDLARKVAGTRRRWPGDLFATHTLRVILDKIIEEHASRLGEQLSPEEATRSQALGSEIAWRVIHDLDHCPEFADRPDRDDAMLDGNASYLLSDVVRQIGWKRKSQRPMKGPDK
jgi:hypothetical protein